MLLNQLLFILVFLTLWTFLSSSQPLNDLVCLFWIFYVANVERIICTWVIFLNNVRLRCFFCFRVSRESSIHGQIFFMLLWNLQLCHTFLGCSVRLAWLKKSLCELLKTWRGELIPRDGSFKVNKLVSVQVYFFWQHTLVYLLAIIALFLRQLSSNN